MDNQLTINTENPKGYICIDDIRFPISAGGTRMISDINEEEIRDLSNAMANKLHSFGFPISGAKAGIDSDNIEDFYKFIAKNNVKSIISGKSGHQFITGPDIGTSEEEYHTALKLAGLEKLIRPGLLSQISKKYGLPFDNIITAYGVLVAAEEVLRQDNSIDPLMGLKVSIEGFGKIGTGLAKLLDGRAKIIAISTRYGCIRAANGPLGLDGGFDINKLLKLQNHYGDRLLFESGHEVMPLDKLFESSCDLLIPGARTKVITEVIAQKIVMVKPKVVVPVANAPYTKKGLEILENAGIICFPDFIASAGAVIAAMIEFANAGGEKEAMELVNAAITWETRDLIMQAIACSDKSKSMYDIAIERAEKKKNSLLQHIQTMKNEFSIQEIANDFILRYAPQLLSN